MVRKSPSRTFAFVTIMVASAGLLTACSHDPDQPSEVTWSAPAWMAEQAQHLEEIDESVQACLDRKGWDVPVDEGGITLNGFSDSDEDLVKSDWQDCLDNTPLATQPMLTEELLRDTMYPRELDIYECLKFQGIDVDDPPPVDVYVDDYLADDPNRVPWGAWSGAWLESLGQPGGLTNADLDILSKECPQQLLVS